MMESTADPAKNSGMSAVGDDDSPPVASSSVRSDDEAPAAIVRKSPQQPPGLCESTKLLWSQAPREFWLLMVLKLLESYSYFSMSLSFTVYLTREFGISDTDAGFLYGLWGMLISVFSLVGGVIVDYLGVRASLIMGAVVATSGRLWFALASSHWELMVTVCVVLPFGLALGIPVLTIGVKRYSNASNRTYAYSLFYAVMNIASLVSGPATDLCRHLIGPEGVEVGSLGHLSELRVLFLTGALASCGMIIVACFFREVNVDQSGGVTEFKPVREPMSQFVRTTCREKRFWRLALFSLLIVLVRLVFRHLDATFPKYLLREFGPDAPYGLIYSINPAMIILLVPIVGAYTNGVHPFKMILQGSFVAASSVFFLVISTSMWTSIAFVVTLSLGEAVYSPRVYEYTMLLAPLGREGLYTSLASAPMFVAKLFAGGMSGALLQEYCPENPPRDCQVMWLIIGVVTMLSPIMMTLLRKVIQPEGTDKRMLADDEIDDEEGGGLQSITNGGVTMEMAATAHGHDGRSLLAGAGSGDATIGMQSLPLDSPVKGGSGDLDDNGHDPDGVDHGDGVPRRGTARGGYDSVDTSGVDVDGVTAAGVDGKPSSATHQRPTRKKRRSSKRKSIPGGKTVSL